MKSKSLQSFQTVAEVLCLLGIITATIVVIALTYLPDSSTTRGRLNSPLQHSASPSPEQIVLTHVDRAQQESIAAIEDGMQEIQRFFQRAKRKTPAFSQAALGWTSKWKLVADATPFTGSGRHDVYMREQFSQHLFSPADLETHLRQTVVGIAAELERIENSMLVDLRADLASRNYATALSTLSDDEIKASFVKTLATTKQHAKADMVGDVVTLASAVVIERIVARTLANLARKSATSGTVLSAGAAGSWASLGLSMAAAVVIDYVISKIWDWVFDPAGSLRTVIDQQLDELANGLCQGTATTPGISPQLRELCLQRGSQWRKVLLAILEESPR
ncbi:hypothetical protein SH139x_005351 [Planctomycetaceae bacterium SH139]